MWANEGGDKVAQGEVRASSGVDVTNRVWNGEAISVFGGKNEVVNFQLILEANEVTANDVAIEFSELQGDDGARIGSQSVTGNNVFNWVDRNIELFYVRYLPIRGLSLFAYPTYDERHVPERLRRPDYDTWGIVPMEYDETTGELISGGWNDRPAHDAYYPDIAVPLEWQPSFAIAQGKSQAIWADIYIPKNAPAGVYQGLVTIREGTDVTRHIPVALQVRNFVLPDTPSAKTMLFMGYGSMNKRYFGEPWPEGATVDTKLDLIRDRHFQLAHRHRIALIDNNDSTESWGQDAPRTEWVPRLNGTLFTPAKGYDGPGVGVSNGVFAIGPYHSWYGANWSTLAQMWEHSDAWVNWFTTHAPDTEYFLYLIDESGDSAQIETWAQWIETNPGPGHTLLSMATTGIPDALSLMPTLDIPTSTMGVGITGTWESAVAAFKTMPDKRVYMYNGRRPAAGTFMTEDDGVALRVTSWAQYKKKIDRWFYWESTYYSDPQTCGDEVNLFQNAKTFGCDSTADPVIGRTGYLYNNGDGVMFYPGTDKLYPQDSYNMNGPIASLRLKYWRRGIQDVDYLTLAAQVNPAAVNAIVQQMIPKVLWEYGVADASDPSWVRTDISWSVDPDVWETARAQLADIIEQGN